MRAKQQRPPLLISDNSQAICTHNPHEGVQIFPIYAYTLSDFCTKTKDPLEKHTKSPGGHTYMIITQTLTYD
jgi:hypothetical protein